MRLVAIALVIALGVAGCSSAASEDPTDNVGPVSRAAVDNAVDQLDGIVAQAMEQTGVPGVSVAVVHGDDVVTTRGYGVRSTESSESVDPDTIFQIASMSKPISGLAAAGMVESGGADWDDPVRKKNPTFALKDPWVSNHVTYGDLFSMRAGLPGMGGNLLEQIGYDREQIIAKLRLLNLNPFRDSYEYSNFSPTAGGSLMANTLGLTWEQAAQRELLDPAGMSSTSYNHQAFVDAKNKAPLHVEIDGQWKPAFERNPNPQAPAGGVSSNVNDLATWARIVLANGKLGDQVIVDEEQFARLVTPWSRLGLPNPMTQLSNSYGLGMNVGADAFGNARWNHSGAFSNGAATTAVFMPAKQIGIVVLTNAAPVGASEGISDAFLDVVLTGEQTTDWISEWQQRMKGVYGEAETIPTPSGSPTPAENLAAYVGTYRNKYVGNFMIRRNGANGLVMIQGPDRVRFPLKHLDGNKFTYAQAPELPDFQSVVTFDVGSGSRARAMNVSAYDEVGWGDLTWVG